MYPNLERELRQRGIAKKELAHLLEVREATVYDKLQGRFEFKLKEAMQIRDHFFPGVILEYLFSREAKEQIRDD